MKEIIEAPAKLNLFLHVIGRRSDSFHNIETLFCFTKVHDRITFELAKDISLQVSGEFRKDLPTDKTNAILKAAFKLTQEYGIKQGAKITLEKNIPLAAGLGGGSSDTAAALIALNSLWGINADKETLAKIGLALGADIPACLYRRPVYASGVGDVFVGYPTFPEIPIVLVNPKKPLLTKDVFSGGLDICSRSEAFLTEGFISIKDLVEYLKGTQNDLTTKAISYIPDIETILSQLQSQKECLLARMSGSGATCFGIFPDIEKATYAADNISELYPKWWVTTTTIQSASET